MGLQIKAKKDAKFLEASLQQKQKLHIGKTHSLKRWLLFFLIENKTAGTTDVYLPLKIDLPFTASSSKEHFFYYF